MTIEYKNIRIIREETPFGKSDAYTFQEEYLCGNGQHFFTDIYYLAGQIVSLLYTEIPLYILSYLLHSTSYSTIIQQLLNNN
jgi:hypothetical protein